jgi:hypothetical protein
MGDFQERIKPAAQESFGDDLIFLFFGCGMQVFGGYNKGHPAVFAPDFLLAGLFRNREDRPAFEIWT